VPSSSRSPWLHSDRVIARSLAQPIVRFLHIEAASGILLLAAALVALAWANSPWAHAYEELWHSELTIRLGGHAVSEDLRHWVNDGLMTLFFFVIGLEIKQEATTGQLASRRDAAIPAAGAIGGMILPAAVYASVNAGGPGVDGWGIPMATDVAFALGVLALLGPRAPAELKVLLLALAIIDDIGAIAVIALFYSDGIDLRWATLAVAGLAATALLRRIRVRFLPVYITVGTVVWLATFESGIHATIAGVTLGLLAPARPFLPAPDADRIADELSTDRNVTASEVREVSFRLREAVPVTERIQDALHPWTSYVVVPLFALANAGLPVSRDTLADTATSRITLGVALGLIVGKTLGVTGGILLARWGRIGNLPDAVTGRHILGMAMIAGIGFTVSIFITGLAFPHEDLADQAKLGVLAGSTIAAALGSYVLSTSRRRKALDR
jgi:NhaA family Na+:H+ antiporter